MPFEPVQYDNLFGSKKRKQKAAQAAQETVKNLIASGQPLSASAQMMALASADGKLSGKEKRLIAKQNRQENKTQRAAGRQQERVSKVEARQQGMTDRTEIRNEAKAQKMQMAKEAATPEMPGNLPPQVDPGFSAIEPAVPGSLNTFPSGGGGGGEMPDLSGWGFQPDQDELQDEATQNKEANQEAETGFKLNPLMIVLLIVAAFFIFKK